MSQIFKNHVPSDILFKLLDIICIKTNKYYILNKISYKKGEYLELFPEFYETLINYYYKSKHYYLIKKHNYCSLVTIIRQICRINNIHYTSKIIYNKSTYDIVYYIYHEK